MSRSGACSNPGSRPTSGSSSSPNPPSSSAAAPPLTSTVGGSTTGDAGFLSLDADDELALVAPVDGVAAGCDRSNSFGAAACIGGDFTGAASSRQYGFTPLKLELLRVWRALPGDSPVLAAATGLLGGSAASTGRCDLDAGDLDAQNGGLGDCCDTPPPPVDGRAVATRSHNFGANSHALKSLSSSGSMPCASSELRMNWNAAGSMDNLPNFARSSASDMLWATFTTATAAENPSNHTLSRTLPSVRCVCVCVCEGGGERVETQKRTATTHARTSLVCEQRHTALSVQRRRRLGVSVGVGVREDERGGWCPE